MNYRESLTHPVFGVVSKIIGKKHLSAYVIGGFVRDAILSEPSKDIDIVVVGSGIDLAHEVAQEMHVGQVSFFKNFGTAMLKFEDTEIEFVGARKESYQRNSRKPIVENGSLEDDQLRRDFTINAMAFDLHPDRFGDLLDPFNGIGDLKLKIIRTPMDPNITFSDDPLRMLRAIRFATKLGFEIHPETFNAIKTNLPRLEIISMERIAEELNKMLCYSNPSQGFILLKETGILKLILPEVDTLSGCEIIEGKGHKDNFMHSLMVLDKVANKSNKLWLRWSALLHDIGKPPTKKFQENGWTFHLHEIIGSKMIPVIFKRMRLPLNENMKYVRKMVSLHLRPIVLSKEEVTDSAIRRLLFDAGNDIEDLMILAEADITSKIETKVQKYLKNYQIVRQKLKEIEEKDSIRNFQPCLTGIEIMEIFGLNPSKEVGIIKDALKDAILDGVIKNTPEEAMDFVKKKAAELNIKCL